MKFRSLRLDHIVIRGGRSDFCAAANPAFESIPRQRSRVITCAHKNVERSAERG